MYHLMNWFNKSASFSSVKSGEANFSLKLEEWGSSPLIFKRCPHKLDTLTTLAWGFKSGNNAWQTANVPK